MADLSTVFARLNGADLEFVDKVSGNVVFAFRNACASLPVYGVANAITAHAGGGQANAVALTSALNRVTVVATTGDSVVLPPASSVTGGALCVINAGANSLNVFPATGDQINALGANAAFALAATKVAYFLTANSGQWHSSLTA